MKQRDNSGTRFVSEEMVPVPGAADVPAMARGEPALPAKFTWRGRQYAVSAVLGTWKTSRAEGGRPDGELYLRRHWYRIAAGSGEVMTVYCERQPSQRKHPKRRWWIYTIESGL